MPAIVLSVNPPKRTRRLDVANKKTLIWAALIIAVVILLDQITKIWAVGALTGQPPSQVLGDFLRFTLAYNEGGAMGTRLGSSTYYLVVAIVIFPFIAYYIYHYRTTRAIAIPLAFIAGGAVGNVIDRIRLGHVIDFIDVDFFDIHIASFSLTRWWTFNIADAAIFCAIIFLVLYLGWFRPHESTHATSDSPVPS